jgi:hypothetical protein
MSERELTEHEQELAREYVQAADAIRSWGEIKNKCRDQLAASLGEDVGTVGGVVAITVSRTRPHRFNLSRFSRDHEALTAQYTEAATTPTVKIIPHKGVPWFSWQT